MIAFRVQRVNPITAKELADLADRMMLVAKSMGVTFEKVHNSMMQVIGAMGTVLQPLFSGDYFYQ